MNTLTRRGRAVSLVEKSMLGAISGAAAAVGVVELAFLVIRVIDLVTDRSNEVAGLTLVDTGAGAFTGASPAVVDATYDSVSLTIEGLPMHVRALLVGDAILGALVPIGICAVLAWLCVRVFLGRPFVASATWGVGIVALLIIVGELGSVLVFSIAEAEVAAFLGLAGDLLPTFLAVVDLAPLGWAAALTVVAAAFEIGQRMQRETEGLV